jgi:hypothetical protein
MFITKKHVPRRTFLRGMGVSLALPLLDSMVAAQTPSSGTALNARPRLAFIYVPHGAIMSQWTPAKLGTDFELTPILQPLEPFRDKLNIVSGLANHNSDNGGHAITTSVWLSGVTPKKTEGTDIAAATTVDQYAAAKIGRTTAFPSIELAIEDVTTTIGGCDTGYSCLYLNTTAWRSPTMPLPMEINPRVVFERLLGEPGTSAQRLARMEEDTSILDSITQEVNRFQKGLGQRDRTRIGQYLENIREIERRIQQTEKRQAGSELTPPDAPVGVPESYEEHVHLMYDLMVLAWQADLTRVSSFMMARELSQRTYPQVGVFDPHHAVSHHGNKPENIANCVKIQNYHVRQLAWFLNKLQATADGDGSLLDHSLIMYGSNLSNSNVHDHVPLPTLLAGGLGGRIKTGRHLKYPDNTPMSNLLMTVLEKVDVEMDHLGDGTGKFADL